MSVPRWGREAPGGVGSSRREAPGRPQGGGPWGYRATHITMPADFMTKKSDLKKINASVAYATNAANAVPTTAPA